MKGNEERASQMTPLTVAGVVRWAAQPIVDRQLGLALKASLDRSPLAQAVEKNSS